MLFKGREQIRIGKWLKLNLKSIHKGWTTPGHFKHIFFMMR